MCRCVALQNATRQQYMDKLRFMDSNKPLRYSTEYNNFMCVCEHPPTDACGHRPVHHLLPPDVAANTPDVVRLGRIESNVSGCFRRRRSSEYVNGR